MSGGEQAIDGDGLYKDRGTQTDIIKLIALHAKEFQNLKPEELKRFELESEKFCNAMTPGGMAAWNPVDYHNSWQLYLNSTGAQELGTLDMTKLRVISANMGSRSNMQIRTDTSLPGIYGVPHHEGEAHDFSKVELVGFDRISMAMALMTAKFEERNGEEVAVCLYPLLKKDGSCEGFVRVIMSDIFKNPSDIKPHKYPIYSQFQNFIHAAVGEKIIEDQNAYRAMMLGNMLEAQGIKDENRYLKIILDQVFRNREGFVRIEGQSMNNSEEVLEEITKLTSDTENISYYRLGTAKDDTSIKLYTRNKPNVSGTGYAHGKNMDPEIDPWIEKYFVVGPGSEFIPLESMEVAIKYPISHANGNVVLAIPEFDRRGNLYTVRFRQFTQGDVKKFNELIDGNKKDNPHHYEPIILSKKNKQ